MNWASMATVGRITRPQHNRGQVVVVPETDFPTDRFAPGATLYTERAGNVVPFRVVDSRQHDAKWVIGFEGIETIDAAEAIRGLELRVPLESLATLGPGAFYAHDLVGCGVQTTAGRAVGPVVKVDLASGVPLLVIDDGGGGEVLVPFAEVFCRRVDLGARLIEIDPPPGLLDLNRRGRP